MNNLQRRILRQELRTAGASDAELQQLVAVAGTIGNLKNNSRLRLILAISIPTVVGLALSTFLVIASQTVLPGNPLYAIQTSSDSIATAVDPSYRGIVMMRRAEQVKQLIDSNAPSDRVLATLADYKKQAAGYKSAAPNYAVFEYCKNNLQQAAAKATDNERQAINNTLSTLANI